MSNINREFGHGFVHVPKTAGTSMERLPFVGGNGHAPARRLRREAPELFWWGFVRHPADRLVSTYYAARTGNYQWKHLEAIATFEEFVLTLPKHFERMPHSRPMTHFLCWPDGSLAVDFVGRFERLDEDWDKLCRRIGVPWIDLPRRNVGQHPPWQECYTAAMMAVVESVYLPDFELFGYKVPLECRLA